MPITICSTCCRSSTNDTTCDECSTSLRADNDPIFYNFSIIKQIAQILDICPITLPDRTVVPSSYSDVTDGELYQRLLHREPDSFLTLTLNVDGVQPSKGSDQSLWPILFVINEISFRQRYAFEHVIVAGMWPGPKKPTRDYMSCFFEQIVDELLVLEQGHSFQLRTTSNELKTVRLKVFLLLCSCDKPAGALLQRIPEPNAAYGCSRCEIRGETSFHFTPRLEIAYVLKHS